MSIATRPLADAVTDAVAALHLPRDARVLEVAPGDADPQIESNRPFDCVIARGALEYAKWPRWLLRRIFYALSPGGYLVVSVPNRLALVDRIQLLPTGAASRSMPPSAPSGPTLPLPPGAGNDRFASRAYTPSELNRQMCEIGFDLVACRTHRRFMRETDGRPLPRRLAAALDWGLERVNRGAGVAFLKIRGGRCLAIGRKPVHSTGAARSDVTPTLTQSIDRFRTFYASEFNRLRSWRHERFIGRPLLPPAAVHDALDRCRSLLVLSPHPDDELIGCGGVMLDIASRGGRVDVMQLTDGAQCQALRDADEHTRRTVRSDEARDVARRMGVTRITFLDAPNGRLDDSAARVRLVRNELNRTRPQIICVPFINDKHADHVAANLLLSSALAAPDDDYTPLILAYEVWSLVPPHVARPIDTFMHRKLDLLMHYPTPMKVVDYIWHCQVRDGHHSRQYLHQTGFAETFLAMTRSDYRQLVESHRHSVELTASAEPVPSS